MCASFHDCLRLCCRLQDPNSDEPLGLLLLISSLVVLQIRLDDPAKYQSIVDAEWDIIYSKLDNIVASGAKVCGKLKADQSPHKREFLVYSLCICACRTHVATSISSQTFF